MALNATVAHWLPELHGTDGRRLARVSRTPALCRVSGHALRPLNAAPLTDMPFTPGKILRALGKI